MSDKKVFISYSHDTPEHSERVLNLAWALRNNGIDVELDQFHNEEIVDWPRWCNQQTSREHSEFVVCVCTAEYSRRIEGKVPPEKGKGVYWEGSLLDDDLYDEKGNSRLMPILLDDESASSIPRFLRGWTHCRMREFALGDSGYEHLIRILTRQAKVEKNPLGTIPVLPTKSAPTGSTSLVKTNFHADISRIIKYAPAELIGREDEIKLLSDAWDKAVHGEAKRPHVLTFVALGGEGKTSLVAKWAAELAHQDWPGYDAAFAWSFYSQGIRESGSSDLFLKEALTFFGDAEMADSAKHATEKGRRLAHLVGQRQALLILDGIEPLQYPPLPPHDGRLKDDGLSALLRGLAQNSSGLCIVTTRYSVPDLTVFWQTTAPQTDLPRLSNAAGIHLLQRIGVRGTTQEFTAMVENVKGHALTLTLLGTYLRDAFAGDIRKRDLVKLEEADAEELGGHAYRVMDAYVKWFQSEGDQGFRALAVLRIIGLFDRPTTADCLAALLQPPAISGMTKALVGLSEAQLNLTLTRLQNARLLTVNRTESGTLMSMDTHSLIREYFARERQIRHLDAWRAAHRRLFEHLCNHKEGDQPTLEDLQPLYQAIDHGCHAGLQMEACIQVYCNRIRRGSDQYAPNKLGAWGSELGAIACFFELPWTRLSSSLTNPAQAWLLGETGHTLLALGRLAEALEPMRASVGLMNKQADWNAASAVASNLSQLKLTLGDVAGAVRDAEQSVAYADRRGDNWQIFITSRSSQADALHQAGRRTEAETRCCEAEQMQKEMQSTFPLLYSVQGFRYCDLLLDVPECAAWQKVVASFSSTPYTKTQTGVPREEQKPDELKLESTLAACRAVCQRAAKTLRIAEDKHLSPHTLFLDHLTLGRAAFYKAILENSDLRLLTSDLSRIDTAVVGLRRSGQQHFLPLGLLTRTWLRFLTGDRTGPESAQEDLDEAWEIAERGPMPLFLADIHLHRARLFFREVKYPWNQNPDGTARGPKDDLAEAERLINKHGYHRRDEELADAKKAILGG